MNEVKSLGTIVDELNYLYTDLAELEVWLEDQIAADRLIYRHQLNKVKQLREFLDPVMALNFMWD